MNQSQAFPNVATPLVALNNGNVSQSWLQFFITLWNRTGGGTGNAGVPSGAISGFGGSDIPSGWLLCDGTPYSRTTYKDLFSAIGTAWGIGDGSSTFNVPDLRDRFVLGAGLVHALASIGGSSTQTLSVANLPPHNHGINDPGHTHAFTGTPHTHTITDPGHSHTTATPASNGMTGTDPVGATSGSTGSSMTGISIDNATAGGANATSTTGVTTANTGSGDPFSILPPFAAAIYMIKI